MLLSVIIPTYKRPQEMLRTLSSLQKQTLKDFEIIVVDNASDPKIKKMIARFNKPVRVSVKYIAEPNLGLHNARHAGARAAKGEILVFTEDEMTFVPNWLKSFRNAFLEYPQMAASGGKISLVWKVLPPTWLISLIGSSKVFPPLGLMEPYDNFHLSKKGFFFGGNMAIRKNILFKVGGFNPEMFGNTWLGDGETGLNRKLWKEKLLIGYVPKAMGYHNISKEKMTFAHLYGRMANTGKCDIYTIFNEAGVPKSWPNLLNLSLFYSFLWITVKYWLGSVFLKGIASFSLRCKLQYIRTKAQIEYIFEIMNNKKLQRLIVKRRWL